MLPFTVRPAQMTPDDLIHNDIDMLIDNETRKAGEIGHDVVLRLADHIRKGSGQLVLDLIKRPLKEGTPEVQIRMLDLLNQCTLNSSPQFSQLLSTEKWTDRFFKIAKNTSAANVRDKIMATILEWFYRYHTVGHNRLLKRFQESNKLGASFVRLRKSVEEKIKAREAQRHGEVHNFDTNANTSRKDALDTEETILLQCQGDLASLEYALEHPEVLQEDDVAKECREHKIVCMRMLESGQHERIATELMVLIDRLSETLELYEAMTGVDMGEGQQAKSRALNDEDEENNEGAETSSVDSEGKEKEKEPVKRIRKSQAPRADAGQLMLQAQLQTEELIDKERNETIQLRQQMEELRRKHEELQNKYKDAKAKNREAVSKLEQYADRVEELEAGRTMQETQLQEQQEKLKQPAPLPPPPLLSEEQGNQMRDNAQAIRAGLREIRERYTSEMVKTSQYYSAQLTNAMAAIVQAAQLERQADQRALQWTQELYKKEIKLRKQYYNTIQELKGNIRVYCRVRPMLPKETQGGYDNVITYPSTDELKFIDAAGRPKLFEFDEVYPPEAPQDKVFEDTSPLIDSVVDGFNVCIFAYGQTGSGKTYTMGGGEGETKGINTRALERLFSIIEERRETERSTVSISVLEIYIEQIHDLLVSKRESASTCYEVKQGGPCGTYVTNLTEVPVNSPSEIYRIMETAGRNRSEGTTNMNEHSSRSHMILYIIVRTTNIQTNIQSFGKLSLVDLAGSERLDKSGAEGQLMKEAVSINKSLSSLGDVIAGLSQSSKHIPFRNSILTYLLQDSMAGQAKVLMFACVSPASYNASETGSTLQFASRARGVAFGQIKKNPTSAQKEAKASVKESELLSDQTINNH